MRTITAIILAIILLAASIGTGSVFAQDGGDDGYPVATETTPDPTDPPPDPPAPTSAPPQPTPEPPARTSEPPPANPTAPRPLVMDASPATTHEPDEPSPVCEGLRSHPVITRLAEHFDVAYEELLVYFCEYDFGVGEINLMMETLMRTPGEITLEELFAMRVDQGLGWGEIWLALGLKGAVEGNSGDAGQHEAFKRNENRAKYNHQVSNAGEDNQLGNEFKPENPPGQDNNSNSNKPDIPPGQDKSDKGNDHPGNTKQP